MCQVFSILLHLLTACESAINPVLGNLGSELIQLAEGREAWKCQS